MSRYMMATKATHTLGDISSDEPDLAIIDSEVGEDYVGEWVTGVGYVGVRFPKATTRELTDDEKAYYRTKVVDAPWGTWPIDPDAPPQDATEDADGPVAPGGGDGTGAGEREAHRTAEGAMDAAIEAGARVLHYDYDREYATDGWDNLTKVDRELFIDQARRVYEAVATRAEPLLRQAAAEEIARRISGREVIAGEAWMDDPDGAAGHNGAIRKAAQIAREVGRGL